MNISVTASENAQVWLTEVDICHRTGPLRMLHSATQTSVFKIILFNALAIKKNSAGSGCPRQMYHDWHDPAEELLVLNLITEVPMPNALFDNV